MKSFFIVLLLVIPTMIFGAKKSITNSIGQKFTLIKSGSFIMGSSEHYGNEEPVLKITISKDFYMQTTEVTQGQWRKLMGTKP